MTTNVDPGTVIAKIVNSFLALIKPRTIYTIGFFGATIYMFVNKIIVPELLKTIDIALLAFYFGEKSAKYLNGNGHK